MLALRKDTVILYSCMRDFISDEFLATLAASLVDPLSTLVTGVDEQSLRISKMVIEAGSFLTSLRVCIKVVGSYVCAFF